MTRKLLQSALCLFLSPLLLAQQNASPRVPEDTKIELLALDSLSSNSAIAGTAVRFAVAKDVVVNGVIVFRAGAPVTGTVTKVVRSVAGKRDGFLGIRVREISLQGGLSLRLIWSDPQLRQTRKERFNGAAVNTLESLGGVALLPLELPMAIAMSAGGDGKPSGKDAILPRCWQVDYWVAAPSTLDLAVLAKAADQTMALPQDECVSSAEKLQIDWSASDLYHLSVE